MTQETITFKSNNHTYTIPFPTPTQCSSILFSIYFTRLHQRLTYWINKQNPAPSVESVQAKYIQLDHDFEFTDHTPDHAEQEARLLAEELIRAKLAKIGLPPPRQSVLDLHIDTLLDQNPAVREAASARLSARLAAQDEILSGLQQS